VQLALWRLSERYMRTDPPPAAPAERPPSPCINVCALDAQGFCIGCLRTGEEIGRWMSMSPAEQWQLLAVLAERRKLTR
jgi:predicted Fe-S protein YdhL (DUF1289 family)